MAERHDQPAASPSGQLLRTLDTAEGAILAAMEWMPYLSDIEESTDEVKANLNRSLQEVSDGLELVRRAKREVEQRILEEAKGVY
jgi:hypothetical protein